MVRWENKINKKVERYWSNYRGTGLTSGGMYKSILGTVLTEEVQNGTDGDGVVRRSGIGCPLTSTLPSTR